MSVRGQTATPDQPHGAAAMSRVQLALHVADLEASIDFYSRLFATSPAKRRPGYANFALAEPPLKLVLFEGTPARRPAWTTSASRSRTPTGRRGDPPARRRRLATRVEDNTTCCYAVQDKVWVTGPGNEPWEDYTVTGDARADLEGRTSMEFSEVGGDGTCCTTTHTSTGTDQERTATAACC